MATRAALTLLQSNTETLTGAVTSGGSAYSLTGATIEMYLKPSAGTADNDASVTKLSTATGEIAVISASGGTYSVAVPASATAAAGLSWYRVDVVVGATRRTVAYGPLITEDV